MYKVLIRSIDLYACQIWFLTKTDEKIIAIIERKVLQQIFCHKKNEKTSYYEHRANYDLYVLYNQPYIVAMKSKIIGWSGHV